MTGWLYGPGSMQYSSHVGASNMSALPNETTPGMVMPQQREPIIQLDDVRLTLAGGSGPVNVLNGLNLSVDPGETVSVVGPSGSGKTTMLMLVAGLERASSGRVVVAGRDLSRLSEDELARFRRGRVGIVFQAFHLIAAMTALENVALPLEYAGRAEALRLAAAGLEAVGLAGRAGHYPGQLSGGEQQRVAIARAFACAPDILLADEPTGNLDQDTGNRVVELLFELQRRHNSTLLLITHDPGLASRCARRILMRDGLCQEEQT